MINLELKRPLRQIPLNLSKKKIDRELSVQGDDYMDYSPDLVMFMMNKDYIQNNSMLKDTFRSNSKDSKSNEKDQNIRKCTIYW